MRSRKEIVIGIRETILEDVPRYERVCRNILTERQRTVSSLRGVLARAELDGLSAQERESVAVSIRKGERVIALAQRALAPSDDIDQSAERLAELFQWLGELARQEMLDLTIQTRIGTH